MSSVESDEVAIKRDYFYLLLSSDIVEWQNASSEVYAQVKLELGIDSEFCTINHGVKGLSLLQFSKKHYTKVIELIKSQRIDDHLQYCRKIVPIEVLVQSSEEKITGEAIRLFKLKVNPSESWKIDINKRHTNISRRTLIDRIASTLITINSNVNLEIPERIIRIEIIGKITGISVLKPEEIHSVKKHVT
ncbi:MAG: THUMP domain-containing protein [Candidatus Hodarchaeales archaeon]